MTPTTADPGVAPRWLLLEGGGSRTWAALATDTAFLSTVEGPGTNPRSVGEHHAAETLTELLSTVLDRASPRACRGVVVAHGAASTTGTAQRFRTLTRAALTRAGVGSVPLLITNDIAPLLLYRDRETVCVVIAGTGTGFAARRGRAYARASGLEWLLSDEGGGHDLATAGLRAAVRALDGRGPDTELLRACRTWCARPDPPLADALFETVYTQHAKPQVATFAPYVLRAADVGDAVASGLLDTAADHLATGAQAVCRAVGITATTPTTLVLAGSLLTRASTVRDRLTSRLVDTVHLGAIDDHHDTDRAAALRHLRQIWQDKPEILASLAAVLPTLADPRESR